MIEPDVRLIMVISFVLIVFALAAMVDLLAEFIVIPMMENYRQCGTVFLCHA